MGRTGRHDPNRRLCDVAKADGNTVFVRDRTTVEARLRGAEQYRLINGTI